MRDAPDPGGCCPAYHRAVELIGRRWTGAIVAVLLDHGAQRFGELRAQVPGLSDRVLSQRMRELEAEAIVVRTVTPGPPVRTAYALTEKGLDLRIAVRAFEAWGQRWVGGDGRGCAAAAPTPDRAAAGARTQGSALG